MRYSTRQTNRRTAGIVIGITNARDVPTGITAITKSNRKKRKALAMAARMVFPAHAYTALRCRGTRRFCIAAEAAIQNLRVSLCCKPGFILLDSFVFGDRESLRNLCGDGSRTDFHRGSGSKAFLKPLVVIEVDITVNGSANSLLQAPTEKWVPAFLRAHLSFGRLRHCLVRGREKHPKNALTRHATSKNNQSFFLFCAKQPSLLTV